MKFRSLIVGLVVVVTASLFQVASVQPASAYPTSTVVVNGHGWGHGRGMGQYGALGYAVNSGWGWQQILDHFYGGTSFGAPAPNFYIGVRIVELDGADTIVVANVPFTAGGQSFSGGQGALIRRVGSNSFQIFRGGGCAGPWGSPIATVGGPVVAASSNSNPGNDLNQMMQMCTPGATRGVRGTVSAIDDSGTQRTVNSLYVEDYLRGVVPREMPASWADLNGGLGMHAVRAQAVAARSYVLASSNYSYATTCNTTACQVYGGAYLNGVYIEDARTNEAIANTAGVVRRMGNGNVARTEFSSSTGGYTAGGTFNAVPDDGDAYAGNANHNWSKTLNVSDIQNSYPSIGSLQSISVTSRNGLGDYGGRVSTMTIAGTSGSVSVTGADFQAKLGLKSTWFQVQNSPSGGVNGYWLLGNDGGVFSFGQAAFYGSMGGRPLNAPIIALTPNVGSQGYWQVASDGGIFAWGSSRFFGSMGGKHLNSPIVGMAVTPTGNGYWLVAADGGIFAYGDAAFYGSMGGQRLNRPIVGMTSTPTGRGYWLVASDGGIFSYGDASFFGSTGSISLRQPIVGMDTTPDGLGYWLVAADGGVFAYGVAAFKGSLPGINVSATVTSMTSTVTGQGYLMTSTSGNVYAFGDAPQFGNLSSASPNFRGTVIGIAAAT